MLYWAFLFWFIINYMHKTYGRNMNQEEKFLNYLTNLTNNSNKVVLESIIEGFKIFSNYKTLTENSDDTLVDTGDADDAEASVGIPQPEAQLDETDTSINEAEDTETSNEEPEEDAVVASEVVAPELLEKVKKLCTEVLGLYKHMTGTEFIKEDENKEDGSSTDDSNESGEVNGDDSIPAPMLEEINLSTRQATNDYTNTDYSNAFDQVFSTLDMAETYTDNIYRNNNIDRQDQVLKNTIPLIDSILNTYMAEFEHMESQHMDAYIPAIRKNIASAVVNWIHTLKSMDTAINQQHSIKGLYGRHVVAKFIEDIYRPATNYTEMITNLFKTGDAKMNGDKLVANLKAITDKISALITKFKSDVQGSITSQTGGKAYTKTTAPQQQGTPA